jgi:hypothetical protein
MSLFLTLKGGLKTALYKTALYTNNEETDVSS